MALSLSKKFCMIFVVSAPALLSLANDVNVSALRLKASHLAVRGGKCRPGLCGGADGEGGEAAARYHNPNTKTNEYKQDAAMAAGGRNRAENAAAAKRNREIAEEEEETRKFQEEEARKLLLGGPGVGNVADRQQAAEQEKKDHELALRLEFA